MLWNLGIVKRKSIPNFFFAKHKFLDIFSLSASVSGILLHAIKRIPLLEIPVQKHTNFDTIHITLDLCV